VGLDVDVSFDSSVTSVIDEETRLGGFLFSSTRAACGPPVHAATRSRRHTALYSTSVVSTPPGAIEQ